MVVKMMELAFNIDYFLGFELTNTLRLVELLLYVIISTYFINRIRIRKKNEEPIIFEIGISLGQGYYINFN